MQDIRVMMSQANIFENRLKVFSLENILDDCAMTIEHLPSARGQTLTSLRTVLRNHQVIV